MHLDGEPSVTTRVFLALLGRLWEEHRAADPFIPAWLEIVEPARHALALASMLVVEEVQHRDGVTVIDVRRSLPDLWTRHWHKPPAGGIPQWDELHDLARESLILGGYLMLEALTVGESVPVWDPVERGEA